MFFRCRDKCKSMENNLNLEKVCISPADEDMLIRVKSLNILNEFKMLGFDTRGGFVGVVQQNIDEYIDYKKVKRLLSFWDGRLKDAELNKKLCNLLEQLRNE